MNMGQIYESRKNFVEVGIGAILPVKRDFKSIQYAHSNTTDGEYIRIDDIIGRSVCLDVTALSLEGIFDEVCRIALLGDDRPSAPRTVIEDRDKLRAIAPLFR